MSEEKSSQEIVDDVFKSATFSDRLWLHITNNIRVIKVIAYAIVSVFILAGMYILISNWNESRMHKAYCESQHSDDAKLKFAEKYSLPFVLLSDPDLVAIKAYGVWQEKKLYGKASMGVVRTTFIIDENGIIEKVMEKVKPDTNAAEILDYVRTK